MNEEYKKIKEETYNEIMKNPINNVEYDKQLQNENLAKCNKVIKCIERDLKQFKKGEINYTELYQGISYEMFEFFKYLNRFKIATASLKDTYAYATEESYRQAAKTFSNEEA